MELLVFGHAGPPVVVFPTSQGAFFEYEDRGMIMALADKLEQGKLRLGEGDEEGGHHRQCGGGQDQPEVGPQETPSSRLGCGCSSNRLARRRCL